MTDLDHLLQRFVDQELPVDERIALLSRLGRDAALRERLIALEELGRDAARLPPPSVPAHFVSAVLARTTDADQPSSTRAASAPAGPRRRAWHRLASVLLAPRRLQWNLAAAALVLVAVAVGLVLPGLQPAAEVPAGEARADTSAAPVLVRLVVLEPDAGTVQVAGDFNAWNPAETPLRPAEGGAWTVTIALAPGRYEYMFVIDGDRWISDPFATERSADGFGSENAVLDVRPTAEDAL